VGLQKRKNLFQRNEEPTMWLQLSVRREKLLIPKKQAEKED